MNHRSDIDFGMFTDKGNEFVDDFVSGNLLNMVRSGYFAIEEDNALQVDWRHIDTHVDAYVYGVADTLALKGIEDFKELGDTVVRHSIKFRVADETSKFIEEVNQETDNSLDTKKWNGS